MITIRVENTDGVIHTLTTEPNPSNNLMELLTQHWMDVPAICGGMAGCGTCHVGIVKGAEKLQQPEDAEAFMLDSLPNLTQHSRLSCQIPLTKDIDGLEITILGDGM
ncbi:MAG: 2Fe-2S iron-sulfur cluster-binding protein [Bacteroidia bacterium]